MMVTSKILLVDEDVEVLENTREILSNNGYEVVAFDCSQKAILEITKNKYDMLVLNYILKGLDSELFVDICNSMNVSSKIIVYSSHDDVDAECKMLDKNVSDFVRESKDQRRLLKRIEMSLKSIVHAPVDKTSVELKSEMEDVVVNCSNRRVLKDGKDIKLSSTEFEILSLFLSQKNEILSREHIHSIVWKARGMELNSYRTIDIFILRLRKKISINCLQSVRGVGYIWSE